jgi:F-type H+-transporting ATPase subunit epsilon
MSTLVCTLVTPEKLVFSEEAEMVVVPGAEGDFGVLAQHAPFISIIRPGVVELHRAGGAPPEKIFISAGYAETHGAECTILAESAEKLSELTREKADAALLTARKGADYAENEFDKARAGKALAVAEARLAAVK